MIVVHQGDEPESVGGSVSDLAFYYCLNRSLVAKAHKAWDVRKNIRAMWYRPKGGGSFAPLDGLRAMAVIWVLLYHVAKAPLKGAFLGPPTEPKPYIDNW